MSQKTLKGRIKYIETSPLLITNVKYLRWKTVGQITPHLLPSSKIPLDWHQPHVWIEGELGLLTLCSEFEHDHYISGVNDASVFSVFRAVAESIDSTEVMYEFNGLIISTV